MLKKAVSHSGLIVALVILGLISLLSSEPVLSQTAPPLTGRQIIDNARKIHEASAEFEVQTMTLVDKGGNQEVREARRWSRKKNDETYRYVFAFLSPSGVKGVGLLTWQNTDRDDDQWLYLPALGDQLKRIARGGRTNYFMGTDFTFEDLVSEDRDKFSYNRRPDENAAGIAYFVVEVLPLDKSVAESSGYSRRLMWLRQDSFFTARVDYYGKDGKLLKRQTLADPAPARGTLWRAKSSTMENFKDNHKTVVVTKSRSFKDADAPEDAFQQRFLTSGKHIR